MRGMFALKLITLFARSREAHGGESGRGMGQEGRPRQLPQVGLMTSRVCPAPLTCDSLSSPGYMLTKLTKTILAHDQELKVRPVSSPIRSLPIDSSCYPTENMGKPDTHGQGMWLLFPIPAAASHTHFFVTYRWVTPRTWQCVS